MPLVAPQAGELIAHSFHAVHGLSVTGLRFSAIYGPWTRPDTAPFKFAVSVMKGQPIPIYAVCPHFAIFSDCPAMRRASMSIARMMQTGVQGFVNHNEIL